MTTRERIADEALTLFSAYGYKGTSVKQIAAAVGIKDSSIYKHFASKQKILDSIVAAIRERIGSVAREFGLPTTNSPGDAALVFGAYDEDQLVDFAKKIYLFYQNDPQMARFWRLGNMERYQNEVVFRVYNKLFLEDSIAYQTELFAEMIRRGAFINVNPQVMAMSFYCPIFFLLSKYSANDEREEEALQVLEKQVRAFYRIYKCNTDTTKVAD